MTLWETQTHIEKEKQVTERICRLWDCDAYKLPINYRVDYAFHRGGRIQCWGEIKNRVKQYETILVSLNKILWGRAMAKETGLPFLLICRYDNGKWFWLDAANQPYRLEWGGMNVMRDEKDQEPVCHFQVPEICGQFDDEVLELLHVKDYTKR